MSIFAPNKFNLLNLSKATWGSLMLFHICRRLIPHSGVLKYPPRLAYGNLFFTSAALRLYSATELFQKGLCIQYNWFSWTWLDILTYLAIPDAWLFSSIASSNSILPALYFCMNISTAPLASSSLNFPSIPMVFLTDQMRHFLVYLSPKSGLT